MAGNVENPKIVYYLRNRFSPNTFMGPYWRRPGMKYRAGYELVVFDLVNMRPVDVNDKKPPKPLVTELSEEEKKVILETYSWIKVPRYKMDENLSWEERYHQLNVHHLAETTFLIEKIRSIIAK